MGRANRKAGGATAHPDRRSDGEMERIASESKRTGLSPQVIDRIDNANVRQVIVDSSSFESPEDRAARQKATNRIRTEGTNDGLIEFYGRPRLATYYEREPARSITAGDLLMDSSRGITAWEVVRAEEKNGQVELDVRVVDVQSGRPLGDPFQTETWAGSEHNPLLRLAVADHETRDALGYSQVYEGYRGEPSDNQSLVDMKASDVEKIAQDMAEGAWERTNSQEQDRLRQQARKIYQSQLESKARSLAASQGQEWPEDEEGQAQLRREVQERELLAARSLNREAEEEVREADIAFREGIRRAADEKAIATGEYNEAARLSPAESRFWAEIDSDEQRLAQLSNWRPRSESALRQIRLREAEAEEERRTATLIADEDARRTYGKPLKELDPALQWVLCQEHLGDQW